MGYLGKQPALQASEYREEFNITSTTTNIITSGFVRTGSSNYLEVYRNGVLLGKADYTLQSDYKTIVLTNAAVAGDIVVVLGRRNLTQGLKVAERRHEHVIQNGETTVTFPFPLTADITDVYINGVKLWYGDGSGDGTNSDYAINPVTRVISFGLNPSVGDTVSIVSREPTSVSSTPLPLIDSNGASVISENGGVISLSADTAVIEGSSSGDLVRITQTGSGNALVVEDSANPDSTPFVVDSNGFVGIGTSSPDVELTVDGQIKAFDSTVDLRMNPIAAANVGIVGTYTNHDVVFYTNASERIRIDFSGNVGIGTGSPETKADLNGVFQVDSVRNNYGGFRLSGDGSGDYNTYFDMGRGGPNGAFRFRTNARPINGGSWGTPSLKFSIFGSGNATLAGTLTENSDERIKTNIENITSALSKVTQMRGVSFDRIDNGERTIGLIAQELEKISPELVMTEAGPVEINNSPPLENVKSISYSLLTVYLIESIKEQQSQIDTLTAKTQEQDFTIASLISRIETLESNTTP